jgi:nitrogen fixation NifU-like protein
MDAKAQIQRLYQETVLNHGKNPLNYGVLDDATHEADEINMLCGDEVHVFMRLVDNRCEKISFTGYGCAVMKASASLMTRELRGLLKEEIIERIEAFENLITGKQHIILKDSPLHALQAVQFYPARIKCALLPWKAAKKSMKSEG